jgi:hypothetical protein
MVLDREQALVKILGPEHLEQLRVVVVKAR